ncbi:MAG: methionine--tRNA ligase [Proteobacteria bacterium]|nr:MAG: methionine--tRNA ligase [Pseudomonadota bacterium]
MSRPYFVTTPIYYANAEPHIGHTYTTVVADTLVRWHRQRGDDAWSVSGTDEHGEKLVEAAAKAGQTPELFTERMSAAFQHVWAELGIAPSRFVRTTEPAHRRNVQAILQRVHAAGWIEAREYEGLYCVGCERFLTERDMENGLCRDHERAPELRRESNYFFLMSREFGWLRGEIESGRYEIRPERYRNEALAMLRDESGLGDLSISRPKSRLAWGIELPFDREHVCYVWFDALISYLTGAGFPDDPAFAQRWANAEHLIGKDILKPHAIFWPIMLKAMGMEPPRRLSVHGYWNVDDRKVSKSLGNMVSPLAMRERYGFETFRWFLLREMSYGLDSNFTEEALVERVNADLANNVGNLVSRTLNLVEKFCDGALPPLDASVARGLEEALVAAQDSIESAMAQLQPQQALAAIVVFASEVNRFLDATKPWKLAKLPSGLNEATKILGVAGRAVAALAELLAPFLPEASARIEAKLAAAPITRGEPLFPRVELRKE